MADETPEEHRRWRLRGRSWRTSEDTPASEAPDSSASESDVSSEVGPGLGEEEAAAVAPESVIEGEEELEAAAQVEAGTPPEAPASEAPASEAPEPEVPVSTAWEAPEEEAPASATAWDVQGEAPPSAPVGEVQGEAPASSTAWEVQGGAPPSAPVGEVQEEAPPPAPVVEVQEAPAPAPSRRSRRLRRGRRGSGERPAGPARPAPARRRRRERDPNLPPPVVRAQAKYVRSSARKARLVCDHIRGKSVEEARAILAHTPRAVARDWSKLLESAVANAEHNHELVGEDLYVMAVKADEGPTIKRFRPRAMGRATRIRKRTSHLTILLTPKE